jgi:hypothetical protein
VGIAAPTFEEFTLRVTLAQVRNPSWRAGQTAFNVLWDMRPDLSEQVRSTSLDPFYVDERLPEFYEFVKENWT